MIQHQEIEDYIPVDINRFIEGKSYPIPLFIKTNNKIGSFLDKQAVLYPFHLEALKSKGITKIYIRSIDREILDKYISSQNHKDNKSLEDKLKEYAHLKDRYFRIDPRILLKDTSIDFSIYVRNQMQFTPIVKVEENKEVDISLLQIPLDKDLFVKVSDIKLYQRYLKKIESLRLNPKDKADINLIVTKEQTSLLMKDIFDNQITITRFEQLKELVDNMFNDIIQNTSVFPFLFSLKQQDYYSYLHSVNVGMLSLGLAIAIDLPKKDVLSIALGALIHDIGKIKIPCEILTKIGKLTEFEFQIYKTHVIEGKKMIEGFNNLTKNTVEPVLMHHEKLSGRGYPFKLSGDKIGLAGRITAIADCYDLLTTPKPHKYPLSAYNALQIICREKKDYDTRLLSTFVKMMGKV